MGSQISSEMDLTCCFDNQISNINSCRKLLSINQMSSAKKRSHIKASEITKSTSTLSRQFFILDQSIQSGNSSSKYSYDLPYIENANQYYERENYQAAINNYMLALQKVQRQDIRLADIHFTIAQCYFNMQNFNTSMKHCKVAQLKYTELQGKNSAGVAMACNLIGHIQTQIGDYTLSQHYYQKAYQIYRQEAHSNIQNLLEAGFNLAALYLNIEQDEKALQVYKQMEEYIEKEANYSRNSTILELYRCQGVNLFKLKQQQKSIQYFYKAFNLSLNLPQLNQVEAQKLINSFKLLKEFIKKSASTKQNLLLSNTIKLFLQLMRQLQSLQPRQPAYNH